MREMKEYKEKIWNFEYPSAEEINKERLNALCSEVKKGTRELEELIEEFRNFNDTAIENMKKLNASYLEVIGYAIKIEEIAKEIQGRILDGGKLVSSIEKIHKNVSDMYFEKYQMLMGELRTIENRMKNILSGIYQEEATLKLQNVIKEEYDKNEIGKARAVMNKFNIALETYKTLTNRITEVIKTKEVKCEDEVADQIRIIANKVKGMYNEFIDMPTPTEAIKKEYEKFREFIENKYK